MDDEEDESEVPVWMVGFGPKEPKTPQPKTRKKVFMPKPKPR